MKAGVSKRHINIACQQYAFSSCQSGPELQVMVAFKSSKAPSRNRELLEKERILPTQSSIQNQIRASRAEKGLRPDLANSCSAADHARDSTRLALNSFTIFDGWLSRNLKTLSMTWSSVAVVSRPQNADQSFARRPAPITPLPLHAPKFFSAMLSHLLSKTRRRSLLTQT